MFHCDLWVGSTIAESGASHLLSALCDDLTQFVISVGDRRSRARTLLVSLFKILLKVGMCGLIVVDAGSMFCGVFAEHACLAFASMPPLAAMTDCQRRALLPIPQ
jgi:hypothetical protein